MTPDDLTDALTARFGKAAQYAPPDAWQVETEEMRLIAIANPPLLKLMTPIMPIAEAQSFITQMLEANFDQTREARYAFHQNVVWGVSQFDFESLTPPLLARAIDQLTKMKSQGAEIFFSRLMEAQITQIITAAKLQGQSLEDTIRTLDRFYSEGVMGEMGEQDYQNKAMTAWRAQLERLWPTVDVDRA
ncbi:hypothetical protein S7335_1578 [Synechococcus sp. PCC 7335]|uniref:hypothetical protein n=1 Tax=Synechococcus sp. (strain ATCC 29403 / PCC 7335) TaxID=91464 RepID=UPI00017ED23D|nr:hypothetical protein [Synechococcus sp. PCC 7335]EDX83881.1 hypothetical protein S7335_1578 [Synechococcus sp. PCC 7335]